MARRGISAHSPICKYPAFISNRNSGQRSRMRTSAIQGDQSSERNRNTAPGLLPPPALDRETDFKGNAPALGADRPTPTAPFPTLSSLCFQ